MHHMLFLKLLVTMLTCMLSSLAMAHGKHVHGEGNLDLVIDKDMVTIALEVPLDSLVGFERAPKTPQEKAALVAAEQALKAADSVWLLTPAANCRSQSSDVVMPTFKGEHADVHASYAFRCASPAQLKALDTSLFKSFKRLHRLDVQRIGPNGQGGGRLTPKQSQLSW